MSSLAGLKKIYYKIKKASYEACVVVPTDEIKDEIVKFLSANDYIVFDLDHIEKYVDWRDEPAVKYMENRVELKKLIKKFKKYIYNDYSEEGKIIYVTKNLDIIQSKIFIEKSIYVLIPSPVYYALKKIPKDEIYEVKATNLKIGKKPVNLKRKFTFKADEEILDFLLKNLKRK
jgi:hypothetical protein